MTPKPRHRPTQLEATTLRLQLAMAAQMAAIARQFKHGASLTRLSRKHSLPLLTIEGVIRMKMLGQNERTEAQPPENQKR